MYPYYWGGNPSGGAMAFPFATLLDNDLGLQDLPEEVREAIEIHKDEIHSEEDFREMAKELMLRR